MIIFIFGFLLLFSVFSDLLPLNEFLVLFHAVCSLLLFWVLR